MILRHSRNVPPSLALTAGLALLSALAFGSPATALADAALEQKLTASAGSYGGLFGLAVAVDGDALVIGEPWANDQRGAVHVYQRTGDSWTQTATLTASDGVGAENLGYSVGIDGDTIVAGATNDDFGADPEQNQGSVYTFARTGAAARTETAKLTASDGATGDTLGLSVAIDGDVIVAGAPEDKVGSNFVQGSVYTFARSGAAARTETAKLTASDGAAQERLGVSVAIEGDTIVAGAPNYVVGSNFAQGSVYTFARSGAAARTETATLTASDGAELDFLGSSVAIDGDTILAGAPDDDFGADPEQDQGSVYTYARTGAAARTETAKLTASQGAQDDRFGDSVAIDGDTILAGAPYDDVGANPDQGSIFTFARNGAAARTETAKLTASDGADYDDLGISVAIEGDTIVAGAIGDDLGVNEERGSASVFFSAPDSDNDGVPDSTDGCSAISASTPSGCPSVNRSLTLSYSKSKKKFKGTLAVSQPSCDGSDPVTVWRRLIGDDLEVGTDEVNAQGKYVVSERGRPGKYYATVEERVVSDVAACELATSPTLRLRG